MGKDNWDNIKDLDSPAYNAVAITPHDANELTIYARAIYIGGDGDIVGVTSGGDTVTFVGLIAGSTLPVRFKIIKATGTTATNLVSLY